MTLTWALVGRGVRRRTPAQRPLFSADYKEEKREGREVLERMIGAEGMHTLLGASRGTSSSTTSSNSHVNLSHILNLFSICLI